MLQEPFIVSHYRKAKRAKSRSSASRTKPARPSQSLRPHEHSEGTHSPVKTAKKPSKVSYVQVADDHEGQRLDNFLMARLKGVPRSHIYRIIRSGEVRINKGRCKPTQRLMAGDRVRLPPTRVAQKGGPVAVGPELAKVLARCRVYQDQDLWIYNKPSGLAVHGGSGISLGLIESLRSLHPEESALELVHRLDRDTSGLIMVSRNRRILKRLQRLIQDGGIDKRYWLLCRGFKGGERNVDAPLLKVMHGTERMVRVSRDGKNSLTRFSLHKRLAKGQWLEAELITGRTHQIRVHAQYGGFPIFGDNKYGNKADNSWLEEQGVKRLCLHAQQLSFRHPMTGEMLHVTAPVDAAFEAAIQQMS